MKKPFLIVPVVVVVFGLAVPELLLPPERVVEAVLPVDLPPPVRTVLLRFVTRVMNSSECCGGAGRLPQLAPPGHRALSA